MKKIARRWTFLLIFAAVFVAALSIPFWSSTADAAIAGPSVCAYYSDATFTTVVGARGVGCCGEVISWGVTTAFRRCERLYCPTVLCPQ